MPDEIFSRTDILQRCDLSVPRTVGFLQQFIDVLPSLNIYQYDERAAALALVEAMHITYSRGGHNIQLTLGHYYHGNSVLHRLDPRISIVVVLFMVVIFC